MGLSSSAKRTGPHQSHLPAGDMRKKSKMSPASDMNSNSVTTVKEQGHNQTLYNETCLVASKSSGDVLLDLVEKAVLRHKHNSEQNAPSSLNQVPPVTTSRYFDKMKQNQASSSSMKLHIDEKPSKLQQDLFDKPRSILPVEQALASTEALFPIYQLEVADMVERSKDKVEGMLAALKNKMVQVKKIGKHGLVHWGGGGVNLPWIRLGEKEEDDTTLMEWREDDWVPDGVGRRTRAASRGRNSFQEYKSLIVKSEKDIVQNKEDIYEFDDNDDDVKNQAKPRMKVSRESPFIDETDEEDNFIDADDTEYGVKKKPGKGRGRGKGKRGGKGGGKGRGGRKGKVDNNPSVEQFFDPIDKSKSVMEESVTNVELPDVGISKDENSHPARASVSPTTAACNRILAGTCKQEYSALGGQRGFSSSSTMTRPENGSCPMCGRVMEMQELLPHARTCQGSSYFCP